jgi:hypothetical protein
VGITTAESWDEYYNGYYGYYYYNYGSPPSVYNFQFTAINSPSPSNDRIYLNLANSSEFYLSGNEVLLQSNNYEVSATPCSESEAERKPSGGVAETLLHETAVSESGYGDLAELSPRGIGSCRAETRRQEFHRRASSGRARCLAS